MQIYIYIFFVRTLFLPDCVFRLSSIGPILNENVLWAVLYGGQFSFSEGMWDVFEKKLENKGKTNKYLRLHDFMILNLCDLCFSFDILLQSKNDPPHEKYFCGRPCVIIMLPSYLGIIIYNNIYIKRILLY